MEPTICQFIEAIHRSGSQMVLAVTGGGTGAIAQLLAVPGGSRSVLEAVVPYGEEALIQFLGHQPRSFCSAPTSREMASRAYDRACWLAAPSQLSAISGKILGVACTASLATDRPKKGDHRFYLTAQSAEGSTTYSVTLSKGARDREAEEALVDAVFLDALAEAVGVIARPLIRLLPGEEVRVETHQANDLIQQLLRGEFEAVHVAIDGRLEADSPRPAALLSGAFNPLHEGHCRLAATASRLTGLPVVFEVSVMNVDKPPLPVDEIRRRAHQFTWRSPLWITRAATFTEKAKLFPRSVFVVGADTAERLLAPRYYQDSEENRNQAFDFIRTQGNRFLVAGRMGGSGTFTCLANLTLPETYRDLFTQIPESEFRADLSSTQLRQQEIGTAELG